MDSDQGTGSGSHSGSKGQPSLCAGTADFLGHTAGKQTGDVLTLAAWLGPSRSALSSLPVNPNTAATESMLTPALQTSESRGLLPPWERIWVSPFPHSTCQFHIPDGQGEDWVVHRYF